MPKDRLEAGTRHPHDGLSAADGGVRRRIHLRDAGRPRVGRLRERARLPRSDVRSARDVPALQAAPARRAAARRRPDGPLRRQGAARRRLAHDPARLHGRRAHRRRRRRLRELDAAEGHPPGDADRHARGRDRVRRGPRRRRVAPSRLKSYARRDRRQRVRRELYPVRNVHQSFGYGLLAGLDVFRPVARHRRLVVPRSDALARRATSACGSSTDVLRRRPARSPTSPVRPGQDRSAS